MSSAIPMTPRRRLAITVVVMAATFIQVLDTTIANVALPHMQATLGAAPDQASWILTSYIIASAVATPLTGWLETRIGRHLLFMISIGGFTLASMLCGVSTSLTMMVAARILQGAFGAFLSPLSQAVVLDIYPASQRARALTIWSMGIMVGPIMGPLLGGWLTESYNWRWVFFINVPVGILTLAGAYLLIPRVRLPGSRFDMIGFGLLAVGLCAAQLMLDRGTQQDWFHSTEIIIEAGLVIGAAWMLARNLQISHNDLASTLDTQRFPLADAGIFERLGIQTQTALAMMDVEVNRQAMMIAYLDDFWLMAVLTLAMIPLVYFLNPMKQLSPEKTPSAVLE